MQIRLKLDAERLTVDDLVELESGSSSVRFLRDFVARFTLNGDGEYMPEAEARAAIGKLTIAELKQVMEQFAEEVKGLQASAIPPSIETG